MNETFLSSVRAAHFVGIGGIGVSAVVRLMLARGISVTGSDREPSSITKKLEELGARIIIGHAAKNLPDDIQALIYSPAIAEDNPELLRARDQGVPLYSYPESLGAISKGMRTIAVAGTHGKTTTTAMIAEVFIDAKLDPTVIVGSLLKSTGSNFIGGKSNLFVVEACEYKRSFLSLFPEILVITNIDNDHLDYFGTIEKIQDAFREFVKKVPETGVIVCDPNGPHMGGVIRDTKARIIDYTKEEFTKSLKVSGEHNIKNGKAAFAVAKVLGVPQDDAMQFLGNFTGTWRRMEYKGITSTGAFLYDDYAHHPTEVKAALQGLRSRYSDKKIRVVFQPHLYSRTKLLLEEFAESFKDSDEVIIAPIYAAREEPDAEITSEILVDAIKKHHKNVRYGGDSYEIQKYLQTTAKRGDLIITMGAGDICKVGESIASLRL